jgi:alpha-mannosidase
MRPGRNFTAIDIGAAWGEPWSTLWIHAVGEVPADWSGVAATEPEVVIDLGFTAGAGFQLRRSHIGRTEA